MDHLADITVDRWLSEAFRKANPSTDQTLRAMFKRTSVAGYQAYLQAFIEMDFTDRLSDLSVPVLLVAGENDHGGGPVPDMHTMAANIADVAFTIIDGAGHIVPFEARDHVTALLEEFLVGIG